MKKHIVRAMMLGLALMLPVAAQAQIDQSYNSDLDHQFWASNWAFGTSFTPTKTNITGAATPIWNASNNNIEAILRIAAFTASGSTLGEAFVPFSLAAGETRWIGGGWVPASVTPGTLYYLQFQTNDPNTTCNRDSTACWGDLKMLYDFWGCDDNACTQPTPPPSTEYAGGNAFYTVGNSTCSGDGSWCGDAVDDNSDLLFEEYYRGTEEQPVTATPEPASLALMVTGLVGIAGVAKRRRRKS